MQAAIGFLNVILSGTKETSTPSGTRHRLSR